MKCNFIKLKCTMHLFICTMLLDFCKKITENILEMDRICRLKVNEINNYLTMA